MQNLIYSTSSRQLELKLQADQIIQRTMTFLRGHNIYLISAQADVTNIGELQWLVNHMLEQCHRIVVLAAQLEDNHLIVAKSPHIPHLYVDEIMDTIISAHGGSYNGNKTFAHATFYQYDLIPDIIDHAVESIVVAMPNT